MPGGDAWDGGLDSDGDDSGGDPDPDSVPVPDPDPDPGPEPDVFGSAAEPVWLARVVVLSPGVVVVVVVAPRPAADTEDSV